MRLGGGSTLKDEEEDLSKPLCSLPSTLMTCTGRGGVLLGDTRAVRCVPLPRHSLPAQPLIPGWTPPSSPSAPSTAQLLLGSARAEAKQCSALAPADQAPGRCKRRFGRSEASADNDLLRRVWLGAKRSWQ